MMMALSHGLSAVPGMPAPDLDVLEPQKPRFCQDPPGWCSWPPFADQVWADTCRPRTEAEIRQCVEYELRKTSMPEEAIQESLTAGDVTLAADRRLNPERYCAQDAVTESPKLSRTFSPEFVCSVGGPDAAGLVNALWIVALLGGVLAFNLFLGRKK
jgi:hypothetical protein